MFSVGIGEIFAILVVCLLLFGPERLPELARQVGRLLGQFQQVLADLQVLKPRATYPVPSVTVRQCRIALLSSGPAEPVVQETESYGSVHRALPPRRQTPVAIAEPIQRRLA